jgi:hypothetical protein
MQKPIGALMVAASFTFLAFAPAVAQTKAPAVVTKVTLNNAKVRVLDNVYAPGAVNPMIKRSGSVVVVISGVQNFKETYADGHTDMTSHKIGDAYWSAAATKSLTNLGTGTVRTLVIQLK